MIAANLNKIIRKNRKIQFTILIYCYLIERSKKKTNSPKKNIILKLKKNLIKSLMTSSQFRNNLIKDKWPRLILQVRIGSFK